MSSAHLSSFQPWTSPFHSPWPPRPSKRSLPEEDNFTLHPRLQEWNTVEDDREKALPKKKRRKTIPVPNSPPLDPAPSSVVDLDTGEELLLYPDHRSSPSAQLSEPDSVVNDNDNVDFDEFIDIRGTSNPPAEGDPSEGYLDDNSQMPHQFRSLPLVLQKQRLTINICPSIPAISLPKIVTSPTRNTRPSYPDGMEIDDENGNNETRNAGTMVVYRPPFSLERIDLDEVVEGVQAMDLD